jgi:4-hydroxybenzoate polyprenyltransferase
MARQSHVEAVNRDASAIGGAPARSPLAGLVVSLRPSQWTKNLFVFAGLLFGKQLFEPGAVAVSCAAFAIFCVLSGVVYLVNDVADRDADRRHPLKSRRPIASGELSPRVAMAAAVVLGAAALACAYLLRPAFALVALAYVVLLVGYSARLKHIVIIDALTIAIGFVLRAVSGAVAIAVPISHWLLVCMVLLALFLALSKRRHELTLLAEGASNHRRILGEYSPYLLDQMIGVVTASTLIAYIFYTISPETVQNFNTEYLALTIPFPLYGIFRYLYLVHKKEGGGSPAEMLLTDRPLLLCVALWVVAVVLIVYGPGEVGGIFGKTS